MAVELRRREWLVLAALGLTGCGTVLHPERRGQPAGRIDWGVFALDALGLIFFFVPGVIAFAVDFATGAIYLPPEGTPVGIPLGRAELKRVDTHAAPSVADVEAVVSAHTGQEVRLRPGRFVTEPLANVGEFWAAHERWWKRHSASG